MVKVTHQEHRDRRDWDTVGARSDIGGQSHFANVIGLLADHVAEGAGQGIDLFEVQSEVWQCDLSGLEGAVVALGAGDRSQCSFAHNFPNSTPPIHHPGVRCAAM